MRRALAVVPLLALGCGTPPPDDTRCTCVPNNASRVGGIDGAALLARLRRHVRDVAQHRNARDVKVDDDELRLAVANFCDPCNTWVTDRLTVDEMFPLARLDEAVEVVCLGLVMRDRTLAFGDARPRACR